MSYRIHIQNASLKRLPVKQAQIKTWITHALKEYAKNAELSIRFTTTEEIHEANKNYRNKDKPTNVLAFEAHKIPGLSMKYQLLGDLMICPDVLCTEAIEQKKTIDAHWAHIIIHGVLHLLGFDHIKKKDEEHMQEKEIHLLSTLGFDNPYVEKE